MGVDYKAVRMYGRYFRDKNEAVEYLQETYPDADIDGESVYFDSDKEVPTVLEGLILKGLNAYTGTDFILGFMLDAAEAVDQYVLKWCNAFPNNIGEAEAQLDVEIY